LKHKALVRKLAQMNEELEEELAKMAQKMEEPEPVEIQEKKIDSAIECSYTEVKVLLKTRKALKEKLKLDASYDNIVRLENILKEKLERNKKMSKLVESQEKGVNRKDKTYLDVKEEIDNAKPTQIEEERLLKHINKELTKQKQQEEQLNKKFKALQFKAEKGQELEAKIQKKEREIEELRAQHSYKEDIKRSKNSDDKFIDLSGAELKALIVKIQNEKEASKKTMSDEKTEVVAQLSVLRENFSELSRQKKINGHRLQELNRLVKFNKDKVRKEEKRNSDLSTKALTSKSQRKRSYQPKLRSGLTFSVSDKGSKTERVRVSNKSIPGNVVVVDVVSVINNS